MKWSLAPESNRQPPLYESGALPIELTRRFARFEVSELPRRVPSRGPETNPACLPFRVPGLVSLFSWTLTTTRKWILP